MENIELELKSIERMLNITGKFDLQVPVIHSIISSMKEHPELTIEEAIESGMMYFKHIIAIET